MKGRKLLLAVVLAAVIGLAGYFLTAAKKEADSDIYFSMTSNAERVDFLNKQGWIVKPDPISTEEITIPAEFNDVYERYDEFQDEQGFDLDDYKGKKAVIYTYEILNYPDYPENVVANMIIANNKLIAGEVTLNEENGFTVPLLSKNTQAIIGD